MGAPSGISKGLSAVAVVVAALGACYNPNIPPNTLRCAMGAGVKQCPDDFQCVAGFCAKIGSSGSGGRTATGGAGGSGGSASGGAGGGTGGTGVVMTAYQSCNILNPGQPNQMDNCAAGLKCMEDCGIGGGQHCYPVCSSDAECPQSACTRTFTGQSGKFCEPPFMECDVTAGAGASNGCGPSLSCHLLSSVAAPSGGDRAVCECQTGSQSQGQSCADNRSCFPGHVCPPPGMPGSENCRRICDPMAAVPGCSGGSTCRPYGTRWGYCF